MPIDDYWQRFEPPPDPPAFAWTTSYLAPMPDGSCLRLPIRDYGTLGVAGLIANQAAFAITDRLSGWMASAVADLQPEIVVGLPTLGHVFGAGVALALGHPNWAAAGYSRKLWYDAALSVDVASSTAPAARPLWLDPRLLPRLRGRRVLLVDDVVATGASLRAALRLLAAARLTPVGVCVAMAQGDRWRADWPAGLPLRAAFATPLFARGDLGWTATPGTCPTDCCQPLRA